MRQDSPTPPGQNGKYSFSLTRIDGECRDILRSLDESGGTASSKQLKADAGVKKNKLHYRLDDVLAEIGLIETFNARPESGGKKLKHASLTAEGRQAIENGLLDDVNDANANLKQLHRELEELKERFGEKADKSEVSWQINDVEAQVNALREDVRAADATEDIEDLDARLARVETGLEDIADQAGDLTDRVAAIEDTGDRLDELASEVNARFERLSEDLEDCDRTENLIALSRQVAVLRDHLDGRAPIEDVERVSRRVSKLDSRVEKVDRTEDITRLKEKVAALDDRVEDRATIGDLEDLGDRVDGIENVLGDVAEQSENNRERLTSKTEQAEYIGLSKKEKREYWLEKAEKRIEEIGCDHRRGVDLRADDDWKILAHLDEGELRLLKQEELFTEWDIERALRSSLPGPCRHGRIRYSLFSWYYDRQR